MKCPECDGRGYVVVSGTRGSIHTRECKSCGGRGTVRDTTIYWLEGEA